MDKNCGIYKITSPSGKIYIGQSIDIKRRWLDYKTRVNCTQRALRRYLKNPEKNKTNLKIY